jgi:hypothetical protein
MSFGTATEQEIIPSIGESWCSVSREIAAWFAVGIVFAGDPKPASNSEE